MAGERFQVAENYIHPWENIEVDPLCFTQKASRLVCEQTKSIDIEDINPPKKADIIGDVHSNQEHCSVYVSPIMNGNLNLSQNEDHVSPPINVESSPSESNEDNESQNYESRPSKGNENSPSDEKENSLTENFENCSQDIDCVIM